MQTKVPMGVSPLILTTWPHESPWNWIDDHQSKNLVHPIQLTNSPVNPRKSRQNPDEFQINQHEDCNNPGQSPIKPMETSRESRELFSTYATSVASQRRCTFSHPTVAIKRAVAHMPWKWAGKMWKSHAFHIGKSREIWENDLQIRGLLMEEKWWQSLSEAAR